MNVAKIVIDGAGERMSFAVEGGYVNALPSIGKVKANALQEEIWEWLSCCYTKLSGTKLSGNCVLLDEAELYILLRPLFKTANEAIEWQEDEF